MLLNGLGSVVKWLNFRLLPEQAGASDGFRARTRASAEELKASTTAYSYCQAFGVWNS